MDREDFGILTTTMDGIIMAMNCMSDQMNNHSTLVVNELKEQREKNTKFMEKVDKKLLEMKKDLQKFLKENEEDTNGRTKQRSIIVKDQRESTVMLDKKLREMTERMEKWERSDDSFRHNLTGQVKEENEKIVSFTKGLIKNYKKKESKRKLLLVVLLPNLRKKEPVSFVRTLGITLQIARIRRKRKQLPHTKEVTITVKKEIQTPGTRNLPISRTTRVENLDKMDPPLQNGNKTANVITVGSRGIGHRNAPSKTSQLTTKSSGLISIT